MGMGRGRRAGGVDRRRVRRLPGMTGALVLAVVSTLGSMPAPAAAMADEAQPPLSEGQKALAEAQESGKRVEVTGERTERTTVYANPDGFTFTLEESAVPVRVPTPSGGWQTAINKT